MRPDLILPSLLMLVMGCLAAAADGPPGLANGGFETAGDGGASQAIPGWTTYGAPTTAIGVVDDSGGGRGPALRMTRGKAFCYGLAVDPEVDYLLSIRVRADHATVRIETSPETGVDAMAAVPQAGESFGWRMVKVPLPARARPPGTREVWIALNATATRPGGAAWFDDVRMEPAAGGPNTVPNPAFDEPVFDVMAVPGWTTDSGGADVALDDEKPHEGTRSLRLTGRGRAIRIVQPIDIGSFAAAGVKRVRLSVWGRCSGLGASRMRVELYGATTTLRPLLSLDGDREWTRGELVVDVARLGGRPAVWINAPQAFHGSAWIDDIRLSAVPDDEPINLLTNSNFQQAVAHQALPDFWGLYGDATLCVEPWSLEHFGIDDHEPGPVSNARVLRIQHPPRGAFMPIPPADRLTMFLNHGGDLELPSGDYTFSVFLKAAKADTAVEAAHPSGAKFASWRVGPQWERYSVTGNDPAMMVSLFLPAPDSLIWISAPQLERGSTATPYRPAPGDADSVAGPPSAAQAARTAATRDDDALPLPVVEEPLRIRLEFDRHSLDEPVRGRLDWTGAVPATVHLRLIGEDGKEVGDSRLKLEIAAPGEHDFALAGSEKPAGSLKVDAVCLSEGRKAGRASAAFTAVAGRPDRVRISGFTRSLLVENQPFFPIMLPLAPERLGDWHLDRLEKAGFNVLAQAPGRLRQAEVMARGLTSDEVKAIRKQLNRLRDRGMKLLWPLAWSFDDWGSTGTIYAKDARAMAKTYARVVTSFRDHPAIVGWYVMDEPSKRQWEGELGFQEEDLALLTAAVRSADPSRPAYINWNHTWAIEPYGGIASTDIVSHDNYAISNEPFDLEELVPAVRMLNDHRARGRPAFEWISGSYDENRLRPGSDAVRVHAWLQLVYGTRGLGYWSLPPMDPKVWAEMKQINTEAAWLNTHVFGDRDSRLVAVRTNSVGVHYAVWRNGNSVYVLGVNTGIGTCRATIDVAAICGHAVVGAKRIFDEGQVACAAGRLEDDFPPCARRVYEVLPAEPLLRNATNKGKK
jgi:hypothetical protein